MVEQHSLLGHPYFASIVAREWGTILVDESEWHGEGDMETFPRLPPKEQFESAVGRVRPFILTRDDVNIGKVIHHLGAYLKGPQRNAFDEIDHRWQVWSTEEAGGKDQEEFRGVGLNGRHVPFGLLGKAWLYGEFVHADAKAQSSIGEMPPLATYISALSHYCPLMDIAVKLLHVLRDEQLKGALDRDFRPLLN